MSTYDNEIIEFLTRKENFEQMVNVMNHYGKVRQHLIQNFWDKTTSHLSKLIAGTEWELVESKNWFDRYSKLGVALQAWAPHKEDGRAPIRVIYEGLSEKPYYGLWINAQSKRLDIDRILEAGRREDWLKEGFRSDSNKHWVFFRFSEYDFGLADTLKKVLPEVADDEAARAASHILSFANDLRKSLDKLLIFK